MTAPDPLAGLLDQLEALPVGRRAETATLRAVSNGPRGRTTPRQVTSIARDERARASGLMAGLHRASGPLLGDRPARWTGTSRSPRRSRPRLRQRRAFWPAWPGARRSAPGGLPGIARFLDRYGPGRWCPSWMPSTPRIGLGYPAGYLGSPHAEPGPANRAGQDAAQARVLRSRARRAGRSCSMTRWSRNWPSPTPGDPVQPSTELTVRVHAASARALDAGAVHAARHRGLPHGRGHRRALPAPVR